MYNKIWGNYCKMKNKLFKIREVVNVDHWIVFCYICVFECLCVDMIAQTPKNRICVF